MDEDALQQVVTRGATDAFPGMGLHEISQYVSLPSGVCDIVAKDRYGRWWVIELKRDAVTATAIAQVLRYKLDLDARWCGVSHHPMIAGLRCSPATAQAAAVAGVAVHVFDGAVIRRLIAEFAVADRVRRRSGSNRTPSRPRGPAVSRGGYVNPARQVLQSELDRQFPPGSLTGRSRRADLRAYWRLACPAAPPDIVDKVVRATAHILGAEPSSALVNRASSWTNLKLSNGAMVAALNANARTIKCDFWLPEALAGTVPYPNKGPRHPHSVWCQPRGLATDSQIDELLRWYDRALQIRQSWKR